MTHHRKHMVHVKKCFCWRESPGKKERFLFSVSKIRHRMSENIYINYNKEEFCSRQEWGILLFPPVYCLRSSQVISVISPMKLTFNFVDCLLFFRLELFQEARTHSGLYTGHFFPFFCCNTLEIL
jgi:hypothetical protein